MTQRMCYYYYRHTHGATNTLLSYIQKEMHRLHTETTRSSDYLLKTVLSYIQKEMHRLHTETTRSADYLLKTVLLLYMLRLDAARVAGYVTTRSRSVRRGRLGGRCSH